MKTVKDITARLRARAEHKLKADIDKWIRSIRNNPLFKAIETEHIALRDMADVKEDEIEAPKPDSPKFETLRAWLWDGKHLAGTLMYKKMLPTYIENETSEFMRSMEGLKEQVDELVNLDN